MTDYIDWGPNFLIGIPVLDEQHRVFVRTVNKLYRALFLLRSGSIKEELFDIFQQLYEYARHHFKTEEAMMEKYGYPKLAHHREAHNQFIKRLHKYFEKLDDSNLRDLGLSLLTFLRQWLLFHVLRMDKEIGNFLGSVVEEEEISNLYKLYGLLSREELLENFEKMINEGRTEAISLIVFDIDDFYIINRRYGFDIGDLILENFAKYLSKKFKDDGCLIAKFDGDRFALLLEDEKSLLRTFKTLERLFIEIENYRFKTIYNHRQEFVRLRISSGVAIYPKHGEDPKDLLSRAEAALKIAKEEGKNRWVMFNEREYLKVERLVNLSAFLEKVLERDLVVPFIQPIFSARDLKPIGGELLLRIYSEDEGRFLSASEFVFEALKLGYIHQLERQMFRKFKESILLSNLKGLSIFINRTITSFEYFEGLLFELEEWMELTDEVGLKLILEVTERSLVEFLELIPLIREKTREKNIFLAVDDFGSGHASFNYLLSFKPDFIKIDGEFVKKGMVLEDGKKILKGMIVLAKDLGIKTIAEYVENEEILDFLTKTEVDFLQGYHLGKPMSLEDFVKGI